LLEQIKQELLACKGCWEEGLSWHKIYSFALVVIGQVDINYCRVKVTKSSLDSLTTLNHISFCYLPVSSLLFNKFSTLHNPSSQQPLKAKSSCFIRQEKMKTTQLEDTLALRR
jgi:hypothetical protein